MKTAVILFFPVFILCGIFDANEKILPVEEEEGFMVFYPEETLYYGDLESGSGQYLRKWTVKYLEGRTRSQYVRIQLDDDEDREEIFIISRNKVTHYGDGMFSPFLEGARVSDYCGSILADFSLAEGETFIYRTGSYDYRGMIVSKTPEEIVISYTLLHNPKGFILAFTKGVGITKIEDIVSGRLLYLKKREKCASKF